MRSLTIILKNIRNQIPYFILIAIYFFFVNIEARKERYTNRTNDKENTLTDVMPGRQEKSIRITIPVIPYNQ